MKRTIPDRVPELTAIAAERGFAEGLRAAKTACVVCAFGALVRLRDAAKTQEGTATLVAGCDDAINSLGAAWSPSSPFCPQHAEAAREYANTARLLC